MIIQQLRLVNFRNHRNLVINFKEGITGIIGANAAGKSSILEGILFALTGFLLDGTKEEAITVGEDSGYVVMTFQLNNKLGRIERHLDVTRTLLLYDGQEYKKATEVKEQWDKLLQVIPEVIERVIFAQQGKIPFLFCGDSNIREKIFQKIFLVPNTERIRNLIYKNYIRQCPPVVPVDDLSLLEITKQNKLNELDELKRQLANLKTLTQQEVENLRDRELYLTSCESSERKRPKLLAEIKDLEQKESELRHKIEEIDEAASLINVYYLNQELERQNTLKENLVKLKALSRKIQETKDSLLPKETKDKLIERLLDTTESVKELELSLHAVKQKIDSVVSNLKKFEKLTGCATCPTCQQSLSSVKPLLDTWVEEKNALQLDRARLSKLLDDKKADKQQLTDYIDEDEGSIRELKELESKAASLTSDNYDPELIELYKQAIERRNALDKKKIVIEEELSDIITSWKSCKKEYNELVIYDGVDINEEKKEIAALLGDNSNKLEARQKIQVLLQVGQARVTELNERILETKKNLKTNMERNRYLEVLNRIYDGFHPSNFPRKLILSYTEAVTEQLREKLEYFNLPYKARITDSFKIELVNEDGFVIPRASGGQQMMIGIALHLALHDMFSQSFPLFMIDEGTTHLSTSNKEDYFNLIEGLKKESKLKQIIVIDHEAQLEDVVDHIIKL